MKYIGQIILLLTATLLAACEQKPYQPPVPHTGQDKSATKLLEPQREALDKAKGVEKAAGQANQEREDAAGKAPGYY